MTDWRDNYAAVWEAREAYEISPSASNRVRLDEAMAASKAHLDCSACPPTGLCFCPPKTRNDSKGDTMAQDHKLTRAQMITAIQARDPEFVDSPTITDSYITGRYDQMMASQQAAATHLTAKLDEHEGRMDGLVRGVALARYEQRRQSAIAHCRGDAAAEKAAVARLDASIAHEAELAEYRAKRAEQTKLDANGEHLSEVVKSQIKYHNRMSTLSSNRGGNFGGNDAA